MKINLGKTKEVFMRQMYQKMAVDIYKKICEKYDKGDPDFIGELFEKIQKTKTHYTIGYEGDKADISYSLTECLKSIDSDAAYQVELLLDRHFMMKLQSPNVEDAREAFCQRVFHYGFWHVNNTVEMIEKYTANLSKTTKSLLDPKVNKILPALKKIENANRADFADILQVLDEEKLDTFQFCDNVENTLKQAFIKDTNNCLAATTNLLQKQRSRLKRLVGEKFDLLIHSASYPEMMMDERSENGFSISIIDDKNGKCYQPGNIKFAYYDGLRNDELLYAKTNDGSTAYDDFGAFEAFGLPDWIPYESFKEKTRNGTTSMNYSELCLSKGNKMKPDAIVCFDLVEQFELEFANKYNLDIILIDTKKYPDMIIRESPTVIHHPADLSQFSQDDEIEKE